MEDLGKKTVRTEVRQYCETDGCRRKFLCTHFGTICHDVSTKHDCCDNCERACSCDKCAVLDVGASSGLDATLNPLTYDVEKGETLYNILSELFEAVNVSSDCGVDAALMTGLTPSLAADVASHYYAFPSIDIMKTNYFYLEQDVVELIYDTLSQFLSL